MTKTDAITPVLGDSEHLFVQANHFIQARYREPLTYWETVIFGKMCTLIGSEDKDFQEYRVYVKDLIEMLDITKTGKVYDEFIEAANRLRTREVVMTYRNDVGQEMILETALITGVARLKRLKKNDDMFVALTIHPKLKPFLLQLRKDFTMLDLRDYKFLHSANGIRIYHILKSYWGRGNGQPEIEVDALKSMLGVGDKYPLYANFKAKVLEDARKRLLEGSRLGFTYAELKEAGRGRGKVVAIRFHLFVNSPKQDMTLDPDPPVQRETLLLPEGREGEMVDELTKLLMSWGVKPKQWATLQVQYSASEIAQAVRVTETALKERKIKASTAGFFISAVKEGYLPKNVVEKPKIVAKAPPKPPAIDLFQEQKVENKRQQFEHDRVIVEKLIIDEPDIINEAIAEIKRGMFGFSYHSDKNLIENRENKVFEAAFINTLKKMKPELF